MAKPPLKFSFDQEKHLYTVNGEVWPSVTGLLQEFKILDFSMVPLDRLNFKRDLGLAVDYACDLWDRDNLDETTLDKRILPYFNAYKKFRELSGFDPDLEKSQCPTVSKKWRFCGTSDLIGRLNEEWVVVDRKCTWSVYPAAGPQLAAYQILAEENFQIKIKHRFALKLNPNGNFDRLEEHEFKDKTDTQDFLACLWLYWQRRNKYRTGKGESNEI